MNDATAEKISLRVLPRIDELQALYIEPRRDDTAITDADSFTVDAITDILIWAKLREGADIDELVHRAVCAASDELAEGGFTL